MWWLSHCSRIYFKEWHLPPKAVKWSISVCAWGLAGTEGVCDFNVIVLIIIRLWWLSKNNRVWLCQRRVSVEFEGHCFFF